MFSLIQRRDRRCFALLAALVVLWLGYPLLHPLYQAFDADSMFLFLPASRVAREQLLSGHVPLWNPNKFLGVPLLANLMVPVFYPPFGIGLLAPQPFGQHLMLLAHYIWAAWGTYALARWGFAASRSSACLAGATFALSAPLIAEIAHPNQLFATSWMPWVWLAARSATRPGTSVWRAGGLALALGLQMLAGQPQIVWFSAWLVGLTAVHAMLVNPREWRRASAATGAGCLLALGLAAIEWIPAVKLADYSIRKTAGADFTTSFALPRANLLTLVFPDAMGSPATGGYRGDWNFTETAVFIGQASLVLAVFGIAARRRRREAWLVAAVALAGLILALGDATPVPGWLAKAIPPLDDFRAPARAWRLTALALALGAAWGMDWLAGKVGGENARAWRLALAESIFILQLAGLAYFRWGMTPFPLTKFEPVRISGIEDVIYETADKPGRVFRLLTQVDYNDPSLPAVRAKAQRRQEDLGALAGLREAMGYDEGMLPTWWMVGIYRHFWRNLYTPRPDATLLGLMGVEFLLADKPVEGLALEEAGRRGEIQVFRNRAYRGEVFTRAHWPEVNWEMATGVFPPAEKQLAPLNILKQTTTRALPEPIVYDRKPWGDVGVSLPAGWSGELILSEGYMPGWIADGNGVCIAATPINAFLMAFEIPAGRDGQWTLRYRPLSFRVGACISAAALSMLAAMAAWNIGRKRKAEE